MPNEDGHRRGAVRLSNKGKNLVSEVSNESIRTSHIVFRRLKGWNDWRSEIAGSRLVVHRNGENIRDHSAVGVEAGDCRRHLAWGGAGLLLGANRSSVHAAFDCDAAEFPGALSANADGEFVLPGTRSRISASVQIGAQGMASKDTIRIDVIRWYPGGNNSQQFTVVRDKPAIMTALCALSGNAAEP
jgi:hypothetical protein